jgi:hypothetical protein
MSPSRSHEIDSLRYYLYISDSKLDMLFEQIDQRALKKLSAELKIDLKVASLTLREADSPAPTRIAKLRIVERFIRAHHNVGTIHEPGGEYFSGQLNMRWAHIAGGLVCFKGTDPESSTGIILAGSIYHVLDEVPRSNLQVPRSQLYGIMDILLEVARYGEPRYAAAPTIQRAWWALSRHGREADTFGDLPTQQLDFLAVPLAETPPLKNMKENRIVLATPLYVAMA